MLPRRVPMATLLGVAAFLGGPAAWNSPHLSPFAQMLAAEPTEERATPFEVGLPRTPLWKSTA